MNAPNPNRTLGRLSAPAAMLTFDSLAEAEECIERFMASYEDAGQALLEIHERQLWREAGYDTFEAYVLERWQFTDRRAYQLMDAGKFLRHLAANRSPLAPPQTEKHFRPLMRVRGPRGEDEQKTWERRGTAWRVVNDQAQNQQAPITAKFVAQVVDRFFRGGSKEPPPPPPPLETEDVKLALQTIVQCGMTPADARLKLGPAHDFEYFDDALDFLEQWGKL